MRLIRCEKFGTKSSSLALYPKRKTDAVERKKLPKKLHRAIVSFADIARAARHKHAGTRSDLGYTKTFLATPNPRRPRSGPVSAHATFGGTPSGDCRKVPPSVSIRLRFARRIPANLRLNSAI